MADYKLNNYIGQHLYTIRKSQGFSQETLAAAVGVSRVQIVNLERGANGVSIETLYHITRILKCGYNDLLPTEKQLKEFIPVDIKAENKKKRLQDKIAFLNSQLNNLK